MTKAEIVSEIANRTGIEKGTILKVFQASIDVIRDSLCECNNVYLRGFGTFLIRVRAKKTARNISQNTAIEIPAHAFATFKPAKPFADAVKKIPPEQVENPEKKSKKK